MASIEVHDVRQKSKADLLIQFEDLKAEFDSLLEAERTFVSRNQLRKCQHVRSSISQVLNDLAKIEEEEEEAFASRFAHQASLKTE